MMLINDILKDTVMFDTETTGLVKFGVRDCNDQPSIIELGAVRVKDGEICDRYDTLVCPGFKLDKRITEITGITDAQLRGAPPFEDVLPEFVKFCQGCNIMMAHNAPFDKYMIDFECMRIDETFEWPELIDTVSEFIPIVGYRARLKDLYNMWVDKAHMQTHRADEDAEMIYHVVKAFIGGL